MKTGTFGQRRPLGSVVGVCGLGLAFLLGSGPAAQVLLPSAHAQSKARHIYFEEADPRAEIAAALNKARQEHKRVILDFGGDWCGDCQVLDIYFHQGQNAALLEKNFILVHVWIGHMDRNLELARQYGVPIDHGVPALSVLDANGKVLHAQSGGEFADMRHMEAQSVTEFLNRWKA